MVPDPHFNHIFEKLRDDLLETVANNVGAMFYYKRHWDEDRADEYAAWGCSDWFFEAAPDGTVTRQMEVYDNGTVMQYHAHHIEDVFGGLSDQPVDHGEYNPFIISREEFESAWNARPSTNRD